MYADAFEATIRSLERERDEAKEKVQEYAEENSRFKSRLEVCLAEKEELKNKLQAQEITQTSGGFDSLNDDTLGVILEFVGKKSYCVSGGINKRCNKIYLSKEWSKETFLYGYAPLSVIEDKCKRLGRTNSLSVGFGVLYFNRRDVLEWAFRKQQEHPNILNEIFYDALKVGRLDICNEIHDRSMEDLLRVRARILSLVAHKGKLDTLKWLDARSYLDSSKIGRCACSAAMNGHLNVLLWLQTKHPFDEEFYCAFSAARGGHLHVLEWLNENGCSFDVNTFGAAAFGGHIHVLEWLRDNNCRWNKSCYESAARVGHVHVLEWLRDNECPRGDAEIDLPEEALEDDVVIWLHNNGFSITRLSL